MQHYDSITKLINLGIREPFTYKEAIEFLGSAIGFGVNTPTPSEVVQALKNDVRVKASGKRGGVNTYGFY